MNDQMIYLYQEVFFQVSCVLFVY